MGVQTGMGVVKIKMWKTPFRMIGEYLAWVSKARGWHPEGKRICILINEGSDKSLLGQVIYGTIRKYMKRIKTAGSGGIADTFAEAVLIKLDTCLRYKRLEIDMLVAIPRHTGFGIYRLPFTNSIAVYIVKYMDGVEPPIELLQKDVLAIWELKLM